jgi:hypothetical protein
VLNSRWMVKKDPGLLESRLPASSTKERRSSKLQMKALAVFVRGRIAVK